MPYSSIAVLVLVVLVGKFAVATGASARAKVAAVAVLLASLAVDWLMPDWSPLVLLCQAFLAIALLLYFKIKP